MKTWYYEKFNPQTGEYKRCPVNDLDGSVTGRVVIDVKTWFDEHPDERIARGWIKHINGDIGSVEYDRQTQYLVKSVRVIDDYTVEDVYNVLDKSEDMMLMEELAEGVNGMVMFQGSAFTVGGGVYMTGGPYDE